MAIRGVILLLLCALFTTNEAQAGSRQELRVGVFNMRWFGSAEHDHTYQLPSTKAERIAAMKDFLEKEVLPVDVMSFEEVVDLGALKQVLPKDFSCASYKHPYKDHQHVAVCVSGNFSLSKVSYDTDIVINELAYYDKDRARPAVRVDVVDKSGTHVLRVVGVHLKSAPNFSLLRLKQAGMIGRDLRNDPNIPMIVMGDFNSYPAAKTGMKLDDIAMIESQLNQSGGGFRHVEHTAPFTFRHGSLTGQFDHFFVNSLIKATSTPHVFPICNTVEDGPGYKDHKYYLRYISDHCPVTMKIQL